MNCFPQGWYLLYTRPRHEKKVASALSEIKLVHYFPVIRALRTLSDRKKYVDTPLFPSYIFVYLQSMEDYYEGLHLEGVCCYVRMGKTIARVEESLINNIKLSIGDEREPEVTDEHFPPGKQLVITWGPLTGLSCEAILNKGKEKYLVRVNLLNRSLLLTVPSSSLMAPLTLALDEN